MEDRLKDPLFRNWVKGALLLDFANDALREFVEPLLVRQHTAITQTILSGGAQTCNACTFRTALQCPTRICRDLKLEIEAAHRYPKPTFDNTTIEACWRNPWALAKCFMPFGYSNVIAATETDFAGITSLIINDLEFDNHVTEDLSDDNNIYRQAKDIRNTIMHTSSFQMTEATFNGYKDDMIQLLSSLNTPTACCVISRIQKLDSNSISPAEASSVISQAVSSIEKYVDELKHQIIPEMREMSERLRGETDKGVATLTDVVSKGVEDIKQTTQDGINALQNQTETSKLDINNQTSRAKGEIETLKDDGLTSITSTTDANTKRLDKQGKEITGSITDRAHREKESIADEGKRIRYEESERLKREAEINRKHIHDIAEDSKISLEKKIETTMKTLRETESESFKKTGQIAEDVLAKTKVLEKIRDDGVHTIKCITNKCIDSLYRGTTDFEKKLQDIRTSTTNSLCQLLDKEAENSVKVSRERMDKELTAEGTKFRQQIKDEVESSVNSFREQLKCIREKEKDFQEQMKDRLTSSEEESVAEDIHERSMPLDTDQQLTSFREEDTPMNEHASLTVQHESDEICPDITGMVKFDETRLAVVDQNNFSVKVVDVSQDTITSRIKLKGRDLHDITSVNEHQLAVTADDKVIILQFYHDELSVERKLKVKGHLGGIVYNKGTFIVSLGTSPFTVKIISMDGKVLRSFTLDDREVTGNAALALYNQSLFITNSARIRNSVLCVSLDGTVQHEYKHETLRNPTGITVGRDGDVYVAGTGSHNVHIISPQCEHKGIIPNITSNMPLALAYCKLEHELYISEFSTSRWIHVAKLK